MKMLSSREYFSILNHYHYTPKNAEAVIKDLAVSAADWRREAEHLAYKQPSDSLRYRKWADKLDEAVRRISVSYKRAET